MTIVILSTLASPALSGHAYLDPGSGSFILQILIASLLGAAFLLRAYWRKVIGFFRRDQPNGDPASTEDDQPNE